MNVTVPVGVPPVPVTVAVKVTGAPDATGLGVAVSDVELAVLPLELTSNDTVGDVLAANVLSPPYTAVME
jgi:hypothetical protein